MKEEMEIDYSNYWKGTLIPMLNQLRAMISKGFQFDSTIMVSNSRKPRDHNGHELPDNLSHPENDRNYFVMLNPTLPVKLEGTVQLKIVVKQEVTMNPEFPAPHRLGYGLEVAQLAPEVTQLAPEAEKNTESSSN